jgi:hypothetical protein
MRTNGMPPESTKPYPWFYAVNDRPVTFVELPSGELDVLVYDFDTGELVSDLGYMSRPFEPGKDVDELTEEQFNQVVAKLRSERE